MMKSAANPQGEISLTVRQTDGKMIVVTLGGRRTVGEVKAEIQRVTGLEARLQILIYGHEELKDFNTLEEKNIVDGDVLFLQPRYDDSVNSIHIVASDDARLTKSFRIQKSTSVDELISKVTSAYPPDTHVSLALHGEILQRGKILADYDFQEGETVSLKVITELEGGVE